MSFGAKMKVGSDRVFEELNDQITGQKQRHRANNGLGRCFALERFRPDAEALGNDLDKDRRQHETRAERYQILEKALSQPVGAGSDQHKSAKQISACSEQTKQKKSGKSHVIEIHLVHLDKETSEQTHGGAIYNMGSRCLFETLQDAELSSRTEACALRGRTRGEQ